MQDQIISALQRKDLDDALRLAQQWVQDEPGQAAPLSWLASVLRQQGHLDQAVAAVDQALTLAPEDASLHLQRGTLLMSGRQFDAATEALQRTTTLDPNKLEGYLAQAHMAIARRDFEHARSLSRTAARLEPEHPMLMALDGMIALHTDDADRALSLLNQAAIAMPDDQSVLYGLGFAFLAKGHLAFAEQSLRKVIDLQPDNSPAKLPLMALVADLSLRQNSPQDAVVMLERMLPLAGADTVQIQRLAGEIQLQAGAPRQAADHAIAGLEADPGDRRALQVALMAWERLGAVDEARGVLERLLETHTMIPELWLGRLAIEPVGSEGAEAVVERWLAAMPEHLPALEARMRLHDVRQQHDQAEAIARRIVAIEPGRVSGEQRIVAALLERNEGAQAVAHVQGMINKAGEQVPPALAAWLGVVQDAAQQQGDAVNTWLSLRQQEVERRLPLPPQAKSPDSWPAMGTIAEGNAARPLFVWGAPGSGVERVVAALNAASAVVRTDRFSPTPPSDPFQRYASLQALATDELTAEGFVQQWRGGLPARGIVDGNVIDWLLWWDNAFLWALRPQLPEGRLMVVLRDPRDMLLDWLAFGGSMPIALRSVGEAADWLVRSLEQVVRLHEQSLYPAVVIRIDGAEGNPEAMAQLLGSAFGMESFPVIRSLPAPRLPAGHWRQYRDVLGAAFNNLTPVAVRLGYPEN